MLKVENHHLCSVVSNFCLISTLLLHLVCRNFSQRGPVGRVFVWETEGDVLEPGLEPEILVTGNDPSALRESFCLLHSLAEVKTRNLVE